MVWPLKLFGKGNASYTVIFYALVHACSPSYTDEEWKTLQLILKQYVFGFLIIVIIML